MKIFELLLASIRALSLIILMLLFVVVYTISLILSKHTPQRAFTLRRNYSKIAIKILNLQIEKMNNPPSDTGVIIVSNHRNFADPIVLSLFVDVFVIAKAEVADMPIINKAVELTGIIYVKREDKSSRTATRETLVNTINENKNVLIFAEGTVSKTKEILPLKYGSFIAAAKNNIKVIPIALEYQSERDLWIPEGFLAQHLRQFGKWKTKCRISFGHPLSDKDGEKLHDKTELWIATEVQKLQNNWTKAFA